MKHKSFYLPFYLIACIFMIYLYACSKGDSIADRNVTPPPPANPCDGTAGPLFTAVKTLINSRCVSCHNASRSNGGANFSVDCNIITLKNRIKIRAVDEGSMPPAGALSANDKAVITAWVNAGGRYSD